MNVLQYKLNAIMAKSRAIYGKRLTGKDYESLISCSSVSEITAYLRTSTSYSSMFDKVVSNDISPGYLEFLIRKNGNSVFERLYRYEVAFGQELYNYFAASSEIELILLKIRAIILNRTEKPFASDSDISKELNSLDLYKITRAVTMQELSQALVSTPYKRVIDKCIRSGSSEFIDYEIAFTNYFNEFEYSLIKKCYGKGNELMTLLSEKADTEFIDKLYRTKKYFKDSSDRILGSCAPVHLTGFTQKQISDLIGAEDEKSVLSVLEKTKYKEYAVAVAEADYAEQAISRLNYKKYRHLLRFSSDPNVIMFCFMFLKDNEITNLIHIIEGVKYKMDTESIKEMLIGVGD